MDLSWDHFNSSQQAKPHIFLKNSNLAMLAFKIKIEHTLTETNYN